MAKARICDICGKIDTNTRVKDFEIYHYELTKNATNYEKNVGFDLCKDCEKELFEWLKIKMEEKDEDSD